MAASSPPEKALELLQELGLKEYEAEAFIALTQISNGTAREVSNISDVPRTRVYDAVESLESKGLVEIQHANPKQFRAVGIDEAVNTLRAKYESRTTSLRATLKDIQPIEKDTDGELPEQVWSLAGRSAITSRVSQLIGNSEDEIRLFVGSEPEVPEPIAEALTDAVARGVRVFVGTRTADHSRRIQSQIPEVTVFTTHLEWMSPPQDDRRATIRQLLLVDNDYVLVNTTAGTEDQYETAVFGEGIDNGFVAVVRGLIPNEAVSVPDGETDTL